MKIIQVITRMILGGAQEVVVMTCEALVKAGHEVVLVYGPDAGPEGSLVEVARGTGARLIEMPSMIRQVSPGTDWRCYRELRVLLAEERPDVVHTHSSKAGIVGRAAAWKEGGAEGVPCVVHTCHGVGFHDGQNPLAYQLYVWAERWAARRCHHLIAVSPQMVDLFEARRIAPREKMTVIGSAVDMQRFDRGEVDRAAAKVAKGFDPGAPVIGLLARLDALKGHRDLIDVLPRLVERFPGMRVVFIGDGYDRAMIEGYVREAGMAELVTFTGLVPRDEVPGWLHTVDVSVLPSYQEGQSITLLQSLLSGCGIVGYDVGGIPSVCIHDETGKLAPLGDKAALAEAMIWMLDHPAQRQRLVEQGQAHARYHFSPQRMTDATVSVYRRVLIPDP